ncbi:MAG: flagellar hook protein FlgE [Alphaproteobacteria bacterium]|nr:flagellar hook protein FlgE [Alphaproteobacteria bacterium]MBU1513407.1 flagellar hook protein FlgE [Alphaproteobacteria bacterium]MBU2096399.1 flagellar hook protein FlgE [Alphaproteobacteria bacterium]MBU2149909.1 flagellar hook protein FlgE [Alphaproteobacteria bacterium]MBU2309893.1 flagellar hook protein FlgE [Alphaproteobacteria bacterium]
MSINSALLAGVSGLVANSSALAAISDNIANVNTVAYKRNQVNFSNVVTAQSVKGKYSAGGVQGVTRQFVSTQGLIQSSGSATDLAISGDGFFVVSNKGAGLTASDPRSFTRQGSFSVDPAGYLRNDSGLFLQGWPVQSDGTFISNPSDLSAMNSINVKNLGAAVSPTSTIGLTANLDKVDTVQPEPIDINIVDAAGGRHTLRATFTRTATVNNWTMAIATVPAADSTMTPAATAIPVTFNTDGTINQVNSAAPGAFSINVGWAAALGLPAQDIAIDFSKVTQYDEPTAVGSISQNGAGAGNVVAIEVDEDGIVSAIYDNSQIRKIAKVGIATFPNADGLAQASGNSYRPTLQAGEMVIKQAGTGGAGQISPSSLEASTVDLSAEFTGLIQTQKAYSACSKIITTADQMLDELINIKR